jgi:hypothetical protein
MNSQRNLRRVKTEEVNKRARERVKKDEREKMIRV